MLFQTDPFWSGTYGAQNVMPAPPPWALPFDYGLVLLAAPLAWPVVRRWPRERRRLMLLWVGLGLVWMYVPVPYQRRFAFGVQPALAVLAAVGLFEMNVWLRAQQVGALWRRLLNYAVVVAGSSTSLLVYVSLVASALLNTPVAGVSVEPPRGGRRGVARATTARPRTWCWPRPSSPIRWPGRSTGEWSTATSWRRCTAMQKAAWVTHSTRSTRALEQRADIMRLSGATVVALGPRERALGATDPERPARSRAGLRSRRRPVLPRRCGEPGARHLAFAVPALVAVLARLLTGPHPIDDAYITFRYARNLAEGLGLVYNPGEWVLGTTTPLWAVLLGAGYRLGFTDLPWLATGVSALCDAAIGRAAGVLQRAPRLAAAGRRPRRAGLGAEPDEHRLCHRRDGDKPVRADGAGWRSAWPPAARALAGGRVWPGLAVLVRPEGALLVATVVGWTWASGVAATWQAALAGAAPAAARRADDLLALRQPAAEQRRRQAGRLPVGLAVRKRAWRCWFRPACPGWSTYLLAALPGAVGLVAGRASVCSRWSI